jgi:hypothetical protein
MGIDFTKEKRSTMRHIMAQANKHVASLFYDAVPSFSRVCRVAHSGAA